MYCTINRELMTLGNQFIFTTTTGLKSEDNNDHPHVPFIRQQAKLTAFTHPI